MTGSTRRTQWWRREGGREGGREKRRTWVCVLVEEDGHSAKDGADSGNYLLLLLLGEFLFRVPKNRRKTA